MRSELINSENDFGVDNVRVRAVACCLPDFDGDGFVTGADFD